MSTIRHRDFTVIHRGTALFQEPCIIDNAISRLRGILFYQSGEMKPRACTVNKEDLIEPSRFLPGLITKGGRREIMRPLVRLLGRRLPLGYMLDAWRKTRDIFLPKADRSSYDSPKDFWSQPDVLHPQNGRKTRRSIFKKYCADGVFDPKRSACL